MGSETILEKRRDYLLPCLGHFYKNPPLFVSGEMQYLFDDHGSRYLDFFAGVSVMNCGHSNPFIIDRVIEQIKKMQHVCNIYLTEPIVLLAERLADFLPGNLTRSFFCNSGSEANEGAFTMARLATGKNKIISLDGGLHGRTFLAQSATQIPMWRTDPFLSDKTAKICYPNTEETARKSLDDLRQLLATDSDFAALIAEPIQGNAGILLPPDWYFKELVIILKKHGVLLIADEVQTGFARCGANFAVDLFKVVPDIITISKAFGNGFPLAAFCTTDEIAEKFIKPSASTLGGNPVSCAAGLAVLDYISENNLSEQSNKLGHLLKFRLQELKNKFSVISEVRGRGLMIGVELMQNGTPLPQLADEILEYLKDNHVILGKNGINRNVLAFQPPLIIDENDIDFLIEKLENAFHYLKC